MLMAVNVGNSLISVGFFNNNDCNPMSSFKIASDIKKTSDEYLSVIASISNNLNINKKDIDGAIISSVVPQITQKIKKTVFCFSGQEPILVGPGVKTGFHIKIDDPSELGGDIVSNTAAVVRFKSEGKCAIVADLGAINTVSAIGQGGEYLGCVIFPGLQTSFDALHGTTAQLPNVDLTLSQRVIGKNSKQAICSGVILGNAMTVDGFVKSFTSEMKSTEGDVELFATGECANDVLAHSRYGFNIDKHLTLKGLYFIYKNTVKD